MESANRLRPVEIDDLIVLILGASGGQWAAGYLEGVTRLEKLVFLAERETPLGQWVTEAADFRSHRFGPFSAKVYQAADSLTAYGLLEDSATSAASEEDRWETIHLIDQQVDPYTNRTFELTERGWRYYRALILELPPEATSTLANFKDRFATLQLSALVRYVYKRYPQFTDKSEIRDQVLK